MIGIDSLRLDTEPMGMRAGTGMALPSEIDLRSSGHVDPAFNLGSMGVLLACVCSSMCSYLRDVGQTILSHDHSAFSGACILSESSLPASVHPLIMANPLAFVIEQARDVLIWGRMSEFTLLTKYLAISLVFLWAGFAFFQTARKGFADVF